MAGVVLCVTCTHQKQRWKGERWKNKQLMTGEKKELNNYYIRSTFILQIKKRMKSTFPPRLPSWYAIYYSLLCYVLIFFSQTKNQNARCWPTSMLRGRSKGLCHLKGTYVFFPKKELINFLRLSSLTFFCYVTASEKIPRKFTTHRKKNATQNNNEELKGNAGRGSYQFSFTFLDLSNSNTGNSVAGWPPIIACYDNWHMRECRQSPRKNKEAQLQLTTAATKSKSQKGGKKDAWYIWTDLDVFFHACGGGSQKLTVGGCVNKKKYVRKRWMT